ncbi:unnamed protein product [Rhizophagus irregularis]|uniref:Uncharacterized protein n=1 Tax=Rhizophagus irregularis TaxID=588596 RepID=A0A915Z5Z1_9GLOM|nr:unnamed protein product [Rhizophagus irregularis]
MVKIKIKDANIVPGASRCGNIVTTLISFALCYTELRFGITRQISVKLRIQQSSCLVVNYLRTSQRGDIIYDAN